MSTKTPQEEHHLDAMKQAFEITKAYASSANCASSAITEVYENLYKKIYETGEKVSNLN